MLCVGIGWRFPTVPMASVRIATLGCVQVKEVSYMHSEGLCAGEMKHGPLALVDEKLPIVVMATMDSMHNKMQVRSATRHRNTSAAVLFSSAA
jgi:glucosamine 6-phosphate synthetase-like amidotransferase/phosphosugar isomerase protein